MRVSCLDSLRHFPACDSLRHIPACDSLRHIPACDSLRHIPACDKYFVSFHCLQTSCYILPYSSLMISGATFPVFAAST
jgi:hypothetical protein